MRCLLFDLDGTLLDTIAGLDRAVNSVLGEMGLPLHSPAALKHMVGEGIDILVTRALPEGMRDAPTVESTTARVKEMYSRTWEEGSWPYEGIPELLAELERRGLDFAVLSNKPDDFTGIMVRRYFPGVRFRDVRGARDGIPKKPDPTAALEIAAGMGYKPADAIFVGDTWVDIQTGKRAGMEAVGVLWGFRERNELLEAGADHMVAVPKELIRLL